MGPSEHVMDSLNLSSIQNLGTDKNTKWALQHDLTD